MSDRTLSFLVLMNERHLAIQCCFSTASVPHETAHTSPHRGLLSLSHNQPYCQPPTEPTEIPNQAILLRENMCHVTSSCCGVSYGVGTPQQMGFSYRPYPVNNPAYQPHKSPPAFFYRVKSGDISFAVHLVCQLTKGD